MVVFTPGTGLFAVYFDGAAAGVPAGARIDALSFTAATGLLLSFDTSVTLPVLGAVHDEDVVGYLAGAFAMVFDGSAAGVPVAQDLDAFSQPPVGSPPGWLLSVDTSGVDRWSDRPRRGRADLRQRRGHVRDVRRRVGRGSGRLAVGRPGGAARGVELPGLAAGAALLVGASRRRRR